MLIVLDGIDLTGKDTLATGLQRMLTERNSGRPALILQEPAAGSFTRAKLREMTSGGRSESWPVETWICTFVAEMLEQDDKAREVVADDRDVIYVRRELSTIAYQCLLSGRMDLIPFALAATNALCKPDLVLWLDGDPRELAERRASIVHKDNDAFEGLELQVRLQRAYAQVMDLYEIARAPVAYVSALTCLDDVLSGALEEIERAGLFRS